MCSSVVVKQWPEPGNDAPNRAAALLGHRWHLFYPQINVWAPSLTPVCVPGSGASFVCVVLARGLACFGAPLEEAWFPEPQPRPAEPPAANVKYCKLFSLFCVGGGGSMSGSRLVSLHRAIITYAFIFVLIGTIAGPPPPPSLLCGGAASEAAPLLRSFSYSIGRPAAGLSLSAGTVDSKESPRLWKRIVEPDDIINED